MKKLLTFLCILSFLSSKAQWLKDDTYGKIGNRGGFKKALLLPTGCGTPATVSVVDSAKLQAMLYFDSCNHKVFFWDPKIKSWDSVYLGISGGGVPLDTLNKFVRKIENNAGVDSLVYYISGTRYAIKYPVGGGTPITNTGSFYRFVVPSSQAVKTLANNWGALIDSTTNSGSLTIWVDSTVVASKGYALSLYDLLNASKLNKADTGTISNRIDLKADKATTLTINGTTQDLSANRTWNVGTVTSVATNTGTGVTGGTITGAGTIANDTLNIVQTKADNKRRLDSIYYAALALKTGIGNFKDSVANVLDPSYGGGNGSALRLQGAVASGKSVFIPYGTRITLGDTTIQLQDYQKLFGGGEIYSSYVGTAAYAGMYHMVKTGKYNTIDGITFRGAGKGTFITTDYYTPQNGIQILDSANLITNCLFFGIKGAGIIGMDYTGSFANNDNNIINNCRFESNTVGVYNFYGGNYQVITGCTMINNYIGIAQQTANAKIVSTSLNYNHIGFIGEGGPADRGQITGCSINHNDTALILKNTSYGYLITGTTFFWGPIYLKDADKATFTNCIIATNGDVKIDGSGVVAKTATFSNCVESNTNNFTTAGTGKILKAGGLTDNMYRYKIEASTEITDSLRLSNIGTNQIDTTNYKPAVLDANGNVKKSFWPTYGGGGGSSRMVISNQTVATDANVTAAAGYVYDLPAATLSTNRNFDVTALNTDGDYIEILNNEAGFTWTFTGATVYLIDRTTTVTTLTTASFYQLRRINGKIIIIN